MDLIVGPFRRQRWRAAWLLQRFPSPIKDQAVSLIDEILMSTVSKAEYKRLSPLVDAIRASVVESLLRTWDDSDLDRGEVRRSLENEFAFESTSLGARGRLTRLAGS